MNDDKDEDHLNLTVQDFLVPPTSQPTKGTRARSYSWYKKATSVFGVGGGSGQQQPASARKLAKASLAPVIDVVSLTERERSMRQSHPMTGRALGDDTDAGGALECLFSQFVVVGPGPGHRSANQIVFKYNGDDDADELPEGLVNFCFPSGGPVQLTENNSVSSAASCCLFTKSDEAYVVGLTSADERTGQRRFQYAVCMRQNLPVERHPFVTLGSPVSADGACGWDTATFCFVLISDYPFFDFHFSVLQAIVDKERQQVLSLAAAAAEPGSSSSTSADGWSLNLLAKIAKAKPPGPDQDLIVNYSSQVFKFHCPAVDQEAVLLARWCLPVLLHSMTVNQFAQILSIVLREVKIGFVCSSERMASCAALALVPCVRPFTLQSVFIPMLPASLLEIMSAPVPLVVGTGTFAMDIGTQSKKPSSMMSWVRSPRRHLRTASGSSSSSGSSAWSARDIVSSASAPDDVVMVVFRPSTGDLTSKKTADLAAAAAGHQTRSSSMEPNWNQRSFSTEIHANKRTRDSASVPLPDWDRFHSLLAPYFQEIQRLVADERRRQDNGSWIPWRPTAAIRKLVEAFSVDLRSYLDSLMADFRAYTVRDCSFPDHPVSAFARPSFLAAHDTEADQPFWEQFLSTQIFSHFEEQQLNFIDNVKKK